MQMGTDHLAEQIGYLEEEKDPMKGNKSSEGEKNGKMEGWGFSDKASGILIVIGFLFSYVFKTSS